MRGLLSETGHEAIWHVTNKIMWWRRLHSPELRLPLHVLGDRVRYQWPVLADSLHSGSLVYSFGIGTNATFELELVARSGCRVFAFDPTPHSAAWARGQRLPRQFRFVEIGIGATDGEMEFHAPSSADEISYSAFGNHDASGPLLRAPVRQLGSIMTMLGHKRLDMLKMDIEGSEYDVVRQLAETEIRPTQLLVEFHQGFYGFTAEDTRRAVRLLRDIGYRIFWVSHRGLEYAFTLSARGRHLS